MMRESFQRQLQTLHNKLYELGSVCERAIDCAVKGLLDGSADLRDTAGSLEIETDVLRKDIETFCVRLLVREQPVAGDLRQITAAQRIIAELERVGDHAADIAELSEWIPKEAAEKIVFIGDMARAAIDMLHSAVSAFVASDVEKARIVVKQDIVVDELFLKVKHALTEQIIEDAHASEACLDLLMVAKYLERIGDHAQNVAEWVIYSVTGDREKAD